MKRRSTNRGGGNGNGKKQSTPRRKRAWWRNRRSLLYFGLSAFMISLVIGAGCAGTKPAKAYRGSLLKTIPVSKALAGEWAKKKFDPSGNCVQIVARDSTNDGVRKVNLFLLFSPDACPGGNQVAERESFALPLVEASTFSAEKLPTVAYNIESERRDAVVGRVDLLTRGDSGSSRPQTSTSLETAKAAAFEADTYELSDICTIDTHFRQNCTMDFTVEGKFSQPVPRVASGRMEREKALLQTILSRIDQSEISLRGALNEVQKNIFGYVKETVKSAEAQILTGQNVAANKTLGYLSARLMNLQQTVNGHTTGEVNQLRTDLMKHIDEMKRETFAKIETEVRTSTAQLSDQLKGMDITFGMRMSALQRTIITDIQGSIATLEKNLTQTQWEAAYATFLGISERLDTIDSEMVRNTTLLATAIANVKLIVERYGDEIKTALRDEIGRAAGRFVLALTLMETRLEGKLSESKFALQGQLTTLTKALETDRKDTVRAILDPLRNQITTFQTTIGDRLNDMEKRELSELSELLARFNGEVARRLRIELGGAARLARAALATNGQRLAGVLTVPEKALFKTAGERLTRLETTLAASHSEASWVVLVQLENDIDSIRGPVFQRLDANAAYRVLDLSRAIREYVGQLAIELRTDIGHSATRLAALLATPSPAIDAALAKALSIRLGALENTLRTQPWENGWQSAQLVDYLLGQAQSKLGTASVRLQGEIEGLRALIAAYQTTTLRSLDGYGPLGGTLESLSATTEPALATLRGQITTALRDGTSLAGSATPLRAEVQRLLGLGGTPFPGSVRQQLVTVDLALGRLLAANQPRTRSLRGATAIGEVLGQQPIRPSRTMMALIGQMQQRLAAVTANLVAGRVAETDAALIALAQLVTSDEFNTQVVENWLAVRADMAKLYTAIDDLRDGLR